MPPYDVNIQWYNNGVAIPGATQPILEITQTGNYTCVGAPSICPDFILGLGVEVSMTFMTPQVPVLNINGNLFVSSPAESYQWFLDGQLLVGETQQSVNALNWIGCYRVLTVDQNQCVAMSEDSLCHVVSLDPFQAIFPVEIYPNPTAEFVWIETEESLARIELFTVNGQLLKTIIPQEKKTPVNLSGYPAGLYFCKVISQNGKEISTKIQKVAE